MAVRPIRLEGTTADQAAAWFARRRFGAPSEAETTAFAIWLEADSAHAEAWSRQKRQWDRLESVRDDPRILAVRKSARHRAECPRSLQRVCHVRVIVRAMLILMGLLWWTNGALITGTHPASTPPFAAPRTQESLPIRVASTDVDERSLLFLPDGSKVMLNSASMVRTDYSAAERRITLMKGQAYFEVAKDPLRPFVVTAGARRVIAVGTAFDVCLSSSQLKVTLVTGKVRVFTAATGNQESAPTSVSELEPGLRLTVQSSGSEKIEKVDATSTTQWRNSKLLYLVFNEERLETVAAEVNRYSHKQLVIADPALRERRVSGVFDPNAAWTVARALEAYGLANAAESTPGVIVLTPP